MKTFIISVLIVLVSLCAWAQDTDPQNYVFTLKGKNRTHEVGLYGGLTGTYSETLSESSGWMSAKAGLVFNHKWAFGWGASGLIFDRRLDALVTDGTYHLEAGYAGIFAEYMLPLGQKVKISFSILSGAGLAVYRYDKDFAEDRPWYQEIIDQETFAVFEPGIELMARISPRWWLGLNGSYRNTSPVKLMGTDDLLFNKFNGGISIRWGIY